ncbi:TIGR02594 family protein [Rhizobium sp. P32RR-XVIII]|uniref:TIGR02594 family protein n=1 Tax=Rhizobium sp. P32RR-XVIII TaxID=2726738 RepID=UPI0014572E05|nr:TIGR02594 family protein [Rhizobium sp. P32RR-XVIII]NLS08030.1 TIGR02594 family protein [Rhizobium sp. P32RR-XVIII]
MVILAVILALLPVPAAQADMLSMALKFNKMHERSMSFLGINARRTSWCGAFLTYVAKHSSRQPPANPNMAVSWINFGRPVSPYFVRAGDVVVTRTGKRFHVSLFHHFDTGRRYVFLFGGNQSNRVQLSRYLASSIVAVRR